MKKDLRIRNSLIYIFLAFFSLIITPIVYKNLPRESRIYIRQYFYKAKVTSQLILDSKFRVLDKCNIKEIDNVPKNATLIVGHAYGDPYRPSSFINQNLYKFIDKNRSRISTIIFTGDVFGNGTKSNWYKLDSSFGDDFEIIVAPGNHDITNNGTPDKNVFKETRFGRKEFPFSLKRNGVNLIIDDSTVNNGVIIKKTIDLINNSKEYENILLRHHMPVIEFELIANNRENENHLPSMKKLSKLFNKKIIIISGDSGAFDHLPRITCRRLNNIVMIANGIGDHRDDQIVILSKGILYRYKINNN